MSKLRWFGIALFLLACWQAAAPLGRPLRVAWLGDSLTAGDGDDRELGYPGRLQARLPAGSQVKKLGRSGWTLEMMLHGYEGQPSLVKQAVGWKPQVSLVWIGSNDLWYLYEYNNPDSAQEKQDVVRFQSQLEEAVQQLQRAGSQVVLAKLDDQSRRPAAIQGKAFTGISRAELARMSVQVGAYNQAIGRVSQKYRLNTVDFSATTLFSTSDTLSDDGNHPNARGYDKICLIWLKALGF